MRGCWPKLQAASQRNSSCKLRIPIPATAIKIKRKIKISTRLHSELRQEESGQSAIQKRVPMGFDTAGHALRIFCLLAEGKARRHGGHSVAAGPLFRTSAETWNGL